MLAPPALIQSAPKEDTAPWQRDLAAFDAELAKRKAAFASKHLSSDRKKDVKEILSSLVDLDQFGRHHGYDPNAHGYAGTPDERAFLVAYLHRLSALDAENLRTFKALLDRWGWFDRGTWGNEADQNAWVLTQHADADLPFQKRVLGLLEPLIESGGTSPSHFAYLYDRVAVNDHRLQRFGTQGYCTGPGAWIPRPIENPAHVDERRKAVGLPPLAEYIAGFKGICQEDETERALKTLPLPAANP